MSILFTSESLKELFHISQAIARENYNEVYGPPHLLQALMHKETGLRDFLGLMGKDFNYIYEWADVRIESYAKNGSLTTEPAQEESVGKIMEEADDIRLRLGLDEVNPLCVLAAITKANVCYTVQELKSLPLREHEILNFFESNDAKAAVEENGLIGDGLQDSKNLILPALKAYCVDMTNLAKEGKIRQVVGRDAEVRTLIEILSRKTKPNVILVGEPGVGKTALIEGFAGEIVKKNVPDSFQDAVLLELNLGLLAAGASYKGEVEDRLQKVVNESKKLHKAILFIDEIHSLLDSRGNFGNVANLLKPELARGGITVIGATTPEEYRKIIEPDRAFGRRFEVLNVEEPDEATCVKMIQNVLSEFEEHHQIQVEQSALTDCVKLAKRYAAEQKLPDSAIDLLDRTMASVKLIHEMSETELTDWKQRYDELIAGNTESDEVLGNELIWRYNLLKKKISPILWGMLSEQVQPEDGMPLSRLKEILERTLDELQRHLTEPHEKVTSLEFAAVMAAKTGIPIGKIQAGEKEKLLRMVDILKGRVVGQDHALKVLSDAIIENRSGLNKPGRPIGSFFLLGPTGTGKTELAKSMAELLFNDEQSMIRFDMSEFKEEHSAALLYGAPPGYVGYEEGGMLVNAIREKPYSVVLFDEIEKAHTSVFDIFLQIMDEGKIHDKLGKEGDFSHSLVLFTSNIGSEQIIEDFEKGDIPDSQKLLRIMTDSRRFRPEFLARITEIIPFSPITETMAQEIFKIQLKSLIKALLRLGIQFEITDTAVRNLALNGFSPKYGARQISGVIRLQIVRPISKKIVSGEVASGQKVKVDFDEDRKETVLMIE